MIGAVTTRIENLAAGWARRRQGRDAETGVTLKRRRIYILPTRYGTIFALVVFAMLLGSMNYASSLGFALTFLLAGLGLVIMHHTHNNLLALGIRYNGARSVFVSERALFRFTIDNEAAEPRQEVEVSTDRRSGTPVDIDAESAAVVDVSVPARRRGWLTLDRFAVATQYPGNLFRAWSWIHMDASCLVYPKPAPPGRPVPPSLEGGGTRIGGEDGDNDFYGLRDASLTDSPRRIAWKAYARNDELLVKQFASSDLAPTMLDWGALPDLEPEARLSQLTRWCLDAETQSRKYGLRLPGTTIEPSLGQMHLNECLGALALFDVGDTA
jgi:uncharacterized protein (DUF58 family)